MKPKDGSLVFEEPSAGPARSDGQEGFFIVPQGEVGSFVLKREIAAARLFAGNSRAPSTEKAYKGDWEDFSMWCRDRGLASMPAAPEVVALYLAGRAERLKTATLERRLASIVVMHRRAGYALDKGHPMLMEVWRGIRRTLGTRKQGKDPILPDELKAMLAALPDTLAGKRDTALLLVAYAGALRRSELVALDAEDLHFSGDGIVLTIRRSKADQEGRGERRAIPKGEQPETCPVAAMREWMLAARINAGPVFRPIDRLGRLGRGRLSDKAVALIVKRTSIALARTLGCSGARATERARQLAGHSLRSGFATAAAISGCEEWQLMRQTGHRTRKSVQAYVRLGNLFRANAATSVGL